MLLELTEKCSMGCTHCMNNATPEGNHMTEETLDDCLDFIVQNRLHTHLIVTGGEPTEHPLFVQMITRIIGRLSQQDRTSVVTITTNGFWCLEHQDIAQDIAKGTSNVHVLWQVSTDDRFYPKKLDTTKRLWRQPGFVLCKQCVERVYPQGRALENKLPWEAKASKCLNVRALAKQLHNPTLTDIVDRLLSNGFFCTPTIHIDGGIGLGESALCPTCTSIYEPMQVIIDKIRTFRCHRCDFINEHLSPIYKAFL